MKVSKCLRQGVSSTLKNISETNEQVLSSPQSIEIECIELRQLGETKEVNE